MLQIIDRDLTEKTQKGRESRKAQQAPPAPRAGGPWVPSCAERTRPLLLLHLSFLRELGELDDLLRNLPPGGQLPCEEAEGESVEGHVRDARRLLPLLHQRDEGGRQWLV